MGLCWSSPPVVEQEVELPDLENQLSAPKPRPTATSWTHKPAILIPATLVCLILSGFALSIFLGYNSMSDPTHRANDLNIQTDGANQPPGQFDLLIPENQTSLDANTTPTDPDPRKSGFMSIPNTPVKVKPEHVDLGSQTKTPLTSISSAPGNSSFKTNEDKIVPIQSDNTPIIKTSPESEPTPLTDLIRVPSAPKPATVEIVIQFTADGSITWTDPENKEEEMEDFEDVLGYIVKKVIAPTFMEREITDHEFLNKINTDRLKSYNKRKAKLFRSTSKKEIRITTFVPKDITFGEAEMRVYLAPNLMTNSYESPNYANLDDDLTKTREDIKTKLSTLFRINATVTVSKFNEAGKPILPIISSTTDKSNSAMSSSETLNTSTLNISKSDNSPAPKPSTVEIVIKFTDDGKEYSYLPNVPLDYLAREVIAPIFVKDGINIYDGIIYTKHETTKKYNKEKTIGEKYGSFQIITLFVAENRTVGKAELMRVYLGKDLMTKYYESLKDGNIKDVLDESVLKIKDVLLEEFKIDATVKVYNEDGKSILPKKP
eukprot:755188_1